MEYLDFSEFFPPRLVDQVGRVLLDGLEGSGGRQGRKIRQPSAALLDDLAGHAVAELAILRHQAQVLVDESYNSNERYTMG